MLCNLIMRVLKICEVKRVQGTAMEHKCLDLRSLSHAPPNLWLLLVIIFLLFRVKFEKVIWDVLMITLINFLDQLK